MTRSPELQYRIERTKVEARSDIAKRGTMQFPIGESDLKRIYEMAQSENKQPGAMVREWVLEHLGTSNDTKNQNKCG